MDKREREIRRKIEKLQGVFSEKLSISVASLCFEFLDGTTEIIAECQEVLDLAAEIQQHQFDQGAE